MHWVVGPLPATAVVGIQVTLGISAIGRLDGQIVVTVDVAVGASRDLARRRHPVGIGQRKARGAVIKIRVLPGNGVVAVGTGGDREHVSRGRVLRIRRLLPGSEMAARVSAVGGGNLQIVVAAYVATLAGNIGMPVGQRKVNRRGGMVKARPVECPPNPAVESVARLAGGREVGSNVVWHGTAQSLRSLEIRLVTGNASSGEPLELAYRCALVAVFALHGCVRSQQRETVLVILHLLHCNIPPLDGVAVGAIRAHLPSMDVVVAVLAILSNIREYRFHMALDLSLIHI